MLYANVCVCLERGREGGYKSTSLHVRANATVLGRKGEEDGSVAAARVREGEGQRVVGEGRQCGYCAYEI